MYYIIEKKDGKVDRHGTAFSYVMRVLKAHNMFERKPISRYWDKNRKRKISFNYESLDHKRFGPLRIDEESVLRELVENGYRVLVFERIYEAYRYFWYENNDGSGPPLRIIEK